MSQLSIRTFVNSSDIFLMTYTISQKVDHLYFYDKFGKLDHFL